MTLFGGSRDISLFNSLNKEIINDIIQTEVGYYKFVLEKTTSNIYGEALGKVFYEPVRIACLINKQDQAWSANDFGSDIDQAVKYKFLKEELRTINLVPEVGDILLFRNNFYEVDGKVENQLILGKDPDYAISTGATDFGNSHSIILRTHLTDSTRLNQIRFYNQVISNETNLGTDGLSSLHFKQVDEKTRREYTHLKVTL